MTPLSAAGIPLDPKAVEVAVAVAVAAEDIEGAEEIEAVEEIEVVEMELVEDVTASETVEEGLADGAAMTKPLEFRKFACVVPQQSGSSSQQ